MMSESEGGEDTDRSEDEGGEDGEKGMVDFGWGEDNREMSGGRRTKKIKELKKKLRPGTFGEFTPNAFLCT